MCYDERRWHAICNHTIQSRLECPKKCTQYGGGLDVVETELPAYCRACLRHVDSQGVVAAVARRPSTSSKRHSRTTVGPFSFSQKQQQQQQQQQQRRPAPTAPLPEPPRSRPNTSSTSASLSELHRSLSERSRKAALGMIMSGFAGAQGQQQQQQQQQGQQRDEPEDKTQDNRPFVLSPSPQKVRKSSDQEDVRALCIHPDRLHADERDESFPHLQPLLSLQIPEDVSTHQPAGRPGSPSSDDGLSSPSTTIVLDEDEDEDEDEEEEADPSIQAAERTPITPWSPPSPTSFSVPATTLPSSRAPTAPLPRLPPLDLSPRATATANHAHNGGGGGGARHALSSGSKSLLRRSRSASRLVFGGGTVLFSARPQLVEIPSPRRSPARSTSSTSLSTTTTATTSSSPVASAPAPMPKRSGSGLGLSASSSSLYRLLRRTKSSKTLADASSTSSPPEKWEVGGALATRMRMRKTSGTNLFSPPPPPPPSSRNLIDIHDPEWLAKHGLKWDAHGLGIVSTAVS